MGRSVRRCARMHASTSTVLPSPISSASMPPRGGLAPTGLSRSRLQSQPLFLDALHCTLLMRANNIYCDVYLVYKVVIILQKFFSHVACMNARPSMVLVIWQTETNKLVHCLFYCLLLTL